MTNKEAVLGFCGITINESTAELELINAGLVSTENYTVANQIPVAKAACEVLNSMLSVSSVKEGDLTVSLDREGIKTRLVSLAGKFGFSEFLASGPTISSPKVW